MSDNIRGALLMMGAMASFTFNDTLMKMLADELPLFEAIFLRGLATSIVLWIMARQMDGLRFTLSRKDWNMVLLRTASEAAAAYFFITALFNMPIANATAILQALPLTVALSAAIFLGEPIGWRRISAILVGFVGVMLIVQPGGDGFNLYSLYALATVVAVTVRDLAARRLSAEVPTLTVAVVGAIGVTLFAAAGMATEDLVAPSPRAWALLAGTVFFIIGAYLFSIATMRVGDIGVSAPMRYTGLLWALLLGLLVFGDWPDRLTLIGSAIVVATGVFTLVRERRSGQLVRPKGLRVR